MRPLRRKLVRDLWRLRYQCVTIALLVGCGIASFVAAVSAAASVQASRDAFYDDARFADIFAHLKAAPLPVLDRLRELPGVAAVAGRVVGDYRVMHVASLVDDFLGIAAYMDAGELSRLMGETPRANVVLLAVDPHDIDEVTRRLIDLPAVASVSRPSIDRGLERAEEGDVLVVMKVILAVFAAAIAVGVVYNNARIAFELRSRDLATMRILGFTKGELAFVLLGEQAIQVVLGLGPGLYLGRAIGALTLKTMDRELLRIPLAVSPASHVGAACVVLLAALLSALAVRSQSDRLDLVAVLKARD